MADELLYIKVMSPQETFFEGQAQSVSSVNSSGPFDVIPEHANFITIIENQDIIVIKPDHQALKFHFTQAIIYNVENKVTIYAEPLSAQKILKM